MKQPEQWLRTLWQQGIAAVQPQVCLPPYVPEPAAGRTVVVGMGKAAGHMALALEHAFKGTLEGVVAVPRGYRCEQTPNTIELLETSHPTPDESSLAAGERLLQAVSGLTRNDLVIALISGGGSAAAEALLPGNTLDELADLTRAMLWRGTDIQKVNAVRASFSRIKAGGLARAAEPASVVGLVIADVPGKDPEKVARVVAGGPVAHGDAPHYVLARGDTALNAAAAWAESQGVAVTNLGDQLQRRASRLARVHAKSALRLRKLGQPHLLLSGGEASVKVTSDSGRGGRNQTYLLSLARELAGTPNTWALAADTDGWDGTDPVAGATIGPGFLEQAHSAGVDVNRALKASNSYDVFSATGSHLITGPTGTNVNDFRAVLVLPD